MEPTVITVEEARQLMTAHGQDMIFIMACNQKTGQTNIVHAGTNEECSRHVAELADIIAKGLECEEPSVSSLSSAQL